MPGGTRGPSQHLPLPAAAAREPECPKFLDLISNQRPSGWSFHGSEGGRCEGEEACARQPRGGQWWSLVGLRALAPPLF